MYPSVIFMANPFRDEYSAMQAASPSHKAVMILQAEGVPAGARFSAVKADFIEF